MYKNFAMCVLAALAVASAGDCAAQSADHSFYVDCSRTTNGNGSLAAPWNNLESVNTKTFSAGDTILMQRGSVCHGALSPRGSGSAGHVIRLTAYGEGNRPRIVADNKVEEALHLFNQEYWDIDSLDISGGNTYGVFISGDKGVLHHIHLSNTAVHDVMGGEMKHKESGLVSISPSSANAHFDDVLVDGVDAWNTNQWVGILIGGGNIGYPPESDWNINAVIRNSTVHDVQGDGIVLFRVRKGLIDSTVAWSIGMQTTESIGTPNAIWTWMCDDCTVKRSEAYLTDSPGFDGGSFDIDYGNTENSVLDSYGHDTQGYCVAVFGAGFVTSKSVVRGNLCINNGRSPRMANYQGAIFLWTWNGGSVDGLSVTDNTIYWYPFENAPALLNRADIKPGTATFKGNTIYSTAPWMVESNKLLSLSQNNYHYYGSGKPQWRYNDQRFANLNQLQHDAGQDSSSQYQQSPLEAWPHLLGARDQGWQLSGTVPVSLDAFGLLDDEARQQLTVLKSFAQQYRPQNLRVNITFTSPDAKLFKTQAFRNAMTDLNMNGISVTTTAGAHELQLALRKTDGKVAHEWNGQVGPVALGLALREALGEPIYAQMGVAQ